MLKWIIIGLVLFLLYKWIRRRPRYDRIFAPDHVIELRRGLAGAKTAALARAGEKPAADPFADGSAFLTSADIAIFYTVAKAPAGGFEHHVSMSYRGGFFARAAAGYLAAVIRRLLDLTTSQCVLAASTSGVYHLIFSLSAEEHARFAAQPVANPSHDAVPALCAQAMAERDALVARMGKLEVDLDKAERSSRED
ncbi:hypothetical protein [Polyangium aurulentum]|uniref:hypothetical protein n=1 Tax=Polyangium aurulentum TaxID=2567896 RepID=UPI0010AEE565|nr:hypothetical protein [Polyangium aurulentum]UQA62771.1 hypothetical protein E8A73_020900 [Polyangium aurulentum]